MSEDKKTRWAYIWALLAIAVSILSGIMAVNGLEKLTLWFFGIVNLCFGPICLFLYIKEVRKGVFAEEEETDQDE